jgi:hypothetical protein
VVAPFPRAAVRVDGADTCRLGFCCRSSGNVVRALPIRGRRRLLLLLLLLLAAGVSPLARLSPSDSIAIDRCVGNVGA